MQSSRETANFISYFLLIAFALITGIYHLILASWSIMSAMNPVVAASLVQAIAILGAGLGAGIWIEYYRGRKEKRAREEMLMLKIYDEFIELSGRAMDNLTEILGIEYVIYRLEKRKEDDNLLIEQYKDQRGNVKRLSESNLNLRILAKKAEVAFRLGIVSRSIQLFAAECGQPGTGLTDDDDTEEKVRVRFAEDLGRITSGLRESLEKAQTRMLVELRDS